jgi:hypothetical protein
MGEIYESALQTNIAVTATIHCGTSKEPASVKKGQGYDPPPSLPGSLQAWTASPQ